MLVHSSEGQNICSDVSPIWGMIQYSFFRANIEGGVSHFDQADTDAVDLPRTHFPSAFFKLISENRIFAYVIRRESAIENITLVTNGLQLMLTPNWRDYRMLWYMWKMPWHKSKKKLRPDLISNPSRLWCIYCKPSRPQWVKSDLHKAL